MIGMSETQTLEGLHVPVPRVRHAALLLAGLLAVLQLMGGGVGQAAALAALPMAFAIGWQRDRRQLPILLVLSLPAFAVSPDAAGLISFPDVVAQAPLAGGGVGAPLVAMAGGLARVCWQLAYGRDELQGVVPHWALALFLLAFVPVGLGALAGHALGLHRWSTAIRAMLAMSGLFWGRLLVRDLDDGRWRLLTQVRTSVVIGCGALLLGALTGHFTFLLVGLATALTPQLLRARRVIGGALAAGVALYGLLSLTLTTAAIVVVTGAALALASMPMVAARRWLLRTGVAAGVLLGVGMIAAVYALRNGMTPAALLAVDRSAGLIAYAQFKLFGDRGPLWLSAIQQILGGPWLIVPTGRSLLPEAFGGLAGGQWDFGPHNSVLELTRNAGVPAAAAALVVIVIALYRAARVLIRSPIPSQRALAAAFVGVALAGMATGDFPVQEVGFFLWVLGGIVIGLDVARTRAVPVPGAKEA